MPYIPTQDGCGAETTAQSVFEDLISDQEFEVPDIDFSSSVFDIPSSNENPLYGEITPLDIAALTEKSLTGSGAFDSIMQAVKAHLEEEFRQQRITGKEYSEVYVKSLTTGMSQAVQFLLGKDAAYWQALTAQAQARRAEVEAVTARVQLETSKMEYTRMRFDAQGAKADYALKKMQLAIGDADYCIRLLQKEGLVIKNNSDQYTFDNMLPQQLALLSSQVTGADLTNAGTTTDNLSKTYTYENILPNQFALSAEQVTGAQRDNTIKQYQIDNMLPAQLTLVLEQGEAQRAQTLNNRSDAAPVSGLIGKQKELYDQQITSYQRDAETKAAKMFIDSWVTQKTIDEGLLAPDALTNAAINSVMDIIRINNSLGSNATDP